MERPVATAGAKSPLLVSAPPYQRWQRDGERLPGSVIAIDLTDTDPGSLAESLRQAPRLQEANPSCPIVLLIAASVPHVLHLVHLHPLRFGVRGVVQVGEDLSQQLRVALTDEAILPTQLARWLLLTRGHTPADAQILELVLTMSAADRLTATVYRQISRRLVTSTLGKLRLPPAPAIRQLGLATRAAVHIQRHPTTRLLEVADALGYEGASGVSHLIRRTFGAAVSDIQKNLGWEWLATRWLRKLGR